MNMGKSGIGMHFFLGRDQPVPALHLTTLTITFAFNKFSDIFQ